MLNIFSWSQALVTEGPLHKVEVLCSLLQNGQPLTCRQSQGVEGDRPMAWAVGAMPVGAGLNLTDPSVDQSCEHCV